MAISGLGSEWVWLYPNRPNPYREVATRTAYNTRTQETLTVRQAYERREQGAPPSLEVGREEEVQQRSRLTTRSGQSARYGDYISIEFRSFDAASNYLFNNPAVGQMLEAQGYRQVMIGVAFQHSLIPGQDRNYPRQKNKQNKIVGYGLRHAFITKNNTTIKSAYSSNALYTKGIGKTEDYDLGEHGRYYIFISQR